MDIARWYIPCIVLEFSENINGPYEDADPFPYNLEMKAFEYEIRYSMGIMDSV